MKVFSLAARWKFTAASDLCTSPQHIYAAPSGKNADGGTSIIWNQISQHGDNVSVICSPNDGCAWRFFDEPRTWMKPQISTRFIQYAVFSISLCETNAALWRCARFFSRRVVICGIAGVKSLSAEIQEQFAWRRFCGLTLPACHHYSNAQPAKVKTWLTTDCSQKKYGDLQN